MIPIMTIDFSPKTAQDNDIKYDDWFLAKNCPRYWYQIWRMIFRQKCPRSWYQIRRMIEKLYIVAKTSGLPNGEVLTHLRRRSSVFWLVLAALYLNLTFLTYLTKSYGNYLLSGWFSDTFLGVFLHLFQKLITTSVVFHHHESVPNINGHINKTSSYSLPSNYL